METTKNFIQWHKLKSAAIVPSKRDEDAGYDLYTIEDGVWLKPHQTRLFSTGICYNIEGNIWLFVRDRGSSGSRGITTHCGICDKGYRGEVFVALCNSNTYPILFTSAVTEPQMKRTWYGRKYLAYPISKGIAQAIPVVMPNVIDYEINSLQWEQVKNNSERGEGKLGESGK